MNAQTRFVFRTVLAALIGLGYGGLIMTEIFQDDWWAVMTLILVAMFLIMYSIFGDDDNRRF